MRFWPLTTPFPCLLKHPMSQHKGNTSGWRSFHRLHVLGRTESDVRVVFGCQESMVWGWTLFFWRGVRWQCDNGTNWKSSSVHYSVPVLQGVGESTGTWYLSILVLVSFGVVREPLGSLQYKLVSCTTTVMDRRIDYHHVHLIVPASDAINSA